MSSRKITSIVLYFSCATQNRMANHFLLFFALLNLAFARSHATLTKEEVYWKYVFPDTPMPKFLHDILPIPGRSATFTADPLFHARDVTPTNKGANDSTTNNVALTNEGEGEEDYGFFNGYALFEKYSTATSDSRTKASKKQSTTNDVAPTNVGEDDYALFSSYSIFDGYSASTKEGVDGMISGNKQLLGRKAYPDGSTIKETICFLEQGLQPGTKVNLPRFIRKPDGAAFLPQQVAESMPMSINKYLEILKIFSLKPRSKAANYVHIAISNCERAKMRGEEKHCTTSFEAFVDLGISMLGRNAKLLSHELGKEINNPKFTIGNGVQNFGQNNVVCHKMKYPYAVYLCHSIKKTEVYMVPLVSQDGTKANALAVCHKDTSAWSPFHKSFQILNVKPGTVPICHFLERDTVVWIPK